MEAVKQDQTQVPGDASAGASDTQTAVPTDALETPANMRAGAPTDTSNVFAGASADASADASAPTEKTIVKVVVAREGKVLLLTKSREGKLILDFPGGHRNKEDKNIDEVLKRELREELGSPFAESVEKHLEGALRRKIHLIQKKEWWLFMVEITDEPPEITLSDEHVAFNWFPVENAFEDYMQGFGAKRSNLRRWMQRTLATYATYLLHLGGESIPKLGEVEMWDTDSRRQPKK